MKRTRVKLILLIPIVLILVFAAKVLYLLHIQRSMTADICNQVNVFLNQKHMGQQFIKIPNLWNADNLVVCRGYLDYSDQLERNLLQTGLSNSVAKKIAKSLRWTEGAHLYFVKNKKIMYCYCPNLTVGRQNTDFIFSKIAKNVSMEVAVEPGANSPDPNIPIASICFLKSFH